MKLRNLLAFLLAIVAGLQSIKAQEAYTVLNGGTMTFYYDNQRSSRPGTSYSIAYTTESDGFPWENDALSVNRVVFDSSYANARPTSTYSWFYGMENLTSIEGMANLNTSEVVNMSFMFNNCKALTSLDLSHFNTEKVRDMIAMFQLCESLTSLDLSHFNTPKLTRMTGMFGSCKSLKSLNVSNFNTSNVTNMDMVFQGCKALTSLDVSNFDTRNVTDMDFMFSECRSLTSLDVSHFNTENVTDMHAMFSSCDSLTSLDLSNFNTENVTDMGSMFRYCRALTSIDLSSFNTSNVTNMGTMFDECESLTSLDVSNFNTENVEDMGWMFRRCESLTSLDVSNFNTARVKSMSDMFYYCRNLTSLDVSNFNTESVENMSKMFRWCKGLTSLDVSNFNTDRVTDMSAMFYRCEGLTSLDLSNFNTENVTNMSAMFGECYHLKYLDLSTFDTGQVTDMSEMFDISYSLQFLDLSSFNTANVTKMTKMFSRCVGIKEIYVGTGWNTDKVNNSDLMFDGCCYLCGEEGTEYDADHVDKAYAHLDGGTSNPGYLSIKPFDFVKDGIFYKITGNNTVAVTNRHDLFDFYRGSVVIPASVDYHGTTYLVTAIEAKAFFYCATMTDITIPSSVTDIGELAFVVCDNLRKITCLAPTPPTIYANTFSNYDVLLIVPAGSKGLYQAAPYWKNFTNIQEPAHYDFEVDYIYYKDAGGNATAEVTYKDTNYGTYSGTVEIPENVISPENGMYYVVTTIGERAFYRCPYLQHLTLPATIDRIENEAFVDAFLDASNSDITCLATTPPSISPYAFGSEINDLTLYVLKDCKAAYMAHNVWKNFGNIVELPYHFQEGKVFYAITGPNTVSVVHRNPSYNSYWGQVTIPSTVKHKGTTYTVTEIGNVAFLSSSQLTRVIIPSTVTRIGNRSFKDCPMLTSITIPGSVTSIGVMCFDGCTALQEVNCWATEPPSIDYTTFTESHYQGVTLNVPAGCLDAYMFANVWELFYDIFDGIGDLKDSKDLEDSKAGIFNLSGQHLSKPQKGINIIGGKKVLVK